MRFRRGWIRLVGIGVLVVAGAEPSAAAQSGLAPVNEPTVCLECHSSIDQARNGVHVHAPFGDGTCSGCHNPHASRHAALLARNQAELCTGCHDDVAESLSRKSVHAPASHGQCTACHEPHAADRAALLREAPPTLCADCHTQVGAWLASAVVHPPVDDGDCTGCHAPHGSGEPSLLRDRVSAVCLDCHDADDGFVVAHDGRNLASANCAACHDPHASSESGLLRPNQHEPFAAGNCAGCHGPARDDDTFAVTSDITELCTTCHTGIRASLDEPFHGHLDLERSCQNCHNPHTSAVSDLLAASQSTLCTKCHFDAPRAGDAATTATTSGKASDMMTHPGVACSECHSPHGAANPRYLRTLDVDLCARCHEGAHRTSHPVGPDVIDPRNGSPVTCLSCHQLHGADFEKYLPKDPAMDLCIQCHQK